MLLLLLDGTVSRLDLDVDSLVDETSLGPVLDVVLLGDTSETPLGRDTDVLATRELVLGTTKRLDHVSLVSDLGADGDEDLTDLNTGNHTVGLSESMTHTGLETISSSTRKHFVDTENVVGVSTDTHVEVILSDVVLHVLVDDNTGGFESFRGDLLLLSRAKVDGGREEIGSGELVTDIVDSDLGIGDTTAVSGLDVRLVLTVAVALGRSCLCHGT